MVEKSNSSSSENINTIQLWNKIEKNVKNKNNEKNIFIVNESNKYHSTKTIFTQEKNNDNNKNNKDNNKDIISDYIIRNNSEEDTYQNNLYDYYLPRYKKNKK